MQDPTLRADGTRLVAYLHHEAWNYGRVFVGERNGKSPLEQAEATILASYRADNDEATGDDEADLEAAFETCEWTLEEALVYPDEPEDTGVKGGPPGSHSPAA